VRRAVLDPGVLVSALITPNGSPAKLLARAHAGELELIVSPLLLGELEEVLSREKFRGYVDLDAVAEYMNVVRNVSLLASDPEDPPPLRSRDPDDDYLIALAHGQSAVLVSGDSDLLDLAGGAPICSPADFLDA
jgi:putative PIN family toxin of toxin-antitoxin system